MWRKLSVVRVSWIRVLVCLSILPTSLLAEDGQHGLLWNRTGLPAVFPLQVKTQPGADLYLVLTDEASDAEALAAYIEGGRHFQVLVPPGSYRVHFAIGQDWQGQDQLFGVAETKHLTVPDPLVFGVVGLSTKAGHTIDLTQSGRDILVEARFICQRFALSEGPRPQAPFEGRDVRPQEITPRDEVVEFPRRMSLPRVPDRMDSPPIASDYAPYFSRPTFAFQARPC
jgi:hypothetical protein